MATPSFADQQQESLGCNHQNSPMANEKQMQIQPSANYKEQYGRYNMRLVNLQNYCDACQASGPRTSAIKAAIRREK